MKVFKVELMIIDFDGLEENGILTELVNAKFANDCMYPRIVSVAERDIGEWDDDHPLNHKGKAIAEFRRLFG